MKKFKSKLLYSVLAASLCLSTGGIITQTTVHAADVSQVADKLMAKHSNIIGDWTRNGLASVEQVKAFINDVARKVDASGSVIPVTAENIGSKFRAAIKETAKDPNHLEALVAAADAFGITSFDDQIPPQFEDMKELIKNEILGSEQAPGAGNPSNPSTGGQTPGGGGGQTPTPETPSEQPKDPVKEEVTNVFSDIKGHWAEQQILKMHEKGIVNGTNGKALPNNKITRAEFATFLVNLLDLKETAELSFKDAKSGTWYHDNLARAYHAGLIKGYSKDEIRPNDYITREQMAVMVYSAMKAKGIQVNTEKELVFKDKGKISSWALEAVKAASSKGIINGFPDQTFDPQGQATRAQAIVMISQLMD